MSDTLFFEMAPIALAKKTGPRTTSKTAEREELIPSPEPTSDSSLDEEEAQEDEYSEDESESDEEDDGVDEAGFEKLIRALGDDGLDEYDQVNLAALASDGEEGEESGEGEDVEGDGEPGEVSGSGDEGEEVLDQGEEGGPGFGSEGAGTEESEFSGEEDALALDELEDVELHPDAVPRRGVKVINNEVRAVWVR